MTSTKLTRYLLIVIAYVLVMAWLTSCVTPNRLYKSDPKKFNTYNPKTGR